MIELVQLGVVVCGKISYGVTDGRGCGEQQGAADSAPKVVYA